MHLKSLELTGFKSFSEARVEFPRGITAVVGPNGTGKSNVVDAILWVLGEQSTKALRSDRMEDVIFNGTQTRKPLGMAEVSLVISDMTDVLPPGVPAESVSAGGFHEVMITRRLYRNGESEYLINKTLCRLKDIRSLLLDTRAGTKGHTVIEQGRIQQILDASPQDRRELIEETAGIIRYKKQKAEALRKLDATQQNLLRVRDIIGEVRKQLNSLDRQARQARTYKQLEGEAKALEIRLLVRDYRLLLADRAAVEAEAAVVEMQEASQAAEQARLQVRLEEVRTRLVAGEQSLGRIRESLARVEEQKAQAVTAIEVERNRQTFLAQQGAVAQQEIARLTQDGAQARDAIRRLEAQVARTEGDLAQREHALAELDAAGEGFVQRRNVALDAEEQARRGILDITVQTTSCRNAVAAAERRQEETGRRLERIGAEEREVRSRHGEEAERLRVCANRRAEAEDRLRDLLSQRERVAGEVRLVEEQLRETDQAISQRRQELAAVESRVRALQGIFREDTGYGREGEEDNTSLRAACQGVRAAVAEWLSVPSELERAIEAALGERVRGWLIEGPRQATDAITFLKSKGLGRGAFVPLSPRGVTGDGDGEARWAALRVEPGVVGRAVDLVTVPSESAGSLACLLDRVLIVESLEAAIRLWESAAWTAADGPTLVTLDGDVLDPSGLLTGGPVNPASGLLQRRREILRLEEKRDEVAVIVQGMERTQADLQHRSETGKAVLESLAAGQRELEQANLALATEEAGLNRGLEALARRLETLRAERESSAEEQRGFEAELTALREQLARLLEESTLRETAHADAGEARRAIEAEAQSWQQAITDARLAVEGLRSALHHARDNATRVRQEQADREARTGELGRQIESIGEQGRESQAELDRKTALFQELEARARGIQGSLTAAQDEHGEEAAQGRLLEGELSGLGRALAASRESRTAVEIRRAEIKTRMETLEGTLTGTYQAALGDALAGEPEFPGGEPREATQEASRELREELQKLRDRLERMGPINLAAIEEHRELEERYRFLTAQETDLAESIKSLKEIISRINHTTKEMFMHTFNELQGKFGEVFARFFGGGRAEMILTDPGETEEPGGGTGAASGREPGVDIIVQPPGKRLKSIAMLSGGEKTLTAMALIFASFLIKPTPFCILDEIDAPLDEENIGRFAGVLSDLSERAQFLVVTHNKRTMSVAHSLFGVTMEEPGVSKLISVRLGDLQPA